MRKAKRVAVEAMTTGSVVLFEDPSDRLCQEARGAVPALAKVDNHRASEADSNWPSIGPCSGSVTAGAHNQTRVRGYRAACAALQAHVGLVIHGLTGYKFSEAVEMFPCIIPGFRV